MNHNYPKIYILILNWNGKEDTIDCLESVLKIDYPNYKTVVMDNGSQDDSVVAIKEKFPEILIIENNANLGFAGGNNTGIDRALSEGADYIFLLNNDTVVDPQILKAFIPAIDKYPQAGIFGSKIYYYGTNKIWYAGAKWIGDRASFIHVGQGKLDNGKDWEEILETDYICGCALLVKSEVVKKIGKLEPKYFLMWEESDFCYRARRAGYQSIIIPQSKVWHKISASFAGGNRSPHYQYFWWRNRLLWLERNINLQESFTAYKIVFRDILRQIYQYLKPPTSQEEKLKFKAALQGIFDYFLRRFGDCPPWVRSRIS